MLASNDIKVVDDYRRAAGMQGGIQGNDAPWPVRQVLTRALQRQQSAEPV